jgi:hypothetical protein
MNENVGCTKRDGEYLICHPEQCHALGAAVDICRDALPWAPRAARTAEGGVGDMARTLSGAP